MPLILYLIFIVSLAILPSLIWLGYYLKRDDKPEPRIRLIIAFGLGVLFTLFAAITQKNVNSLISSFNNIYLSSFIFFLIFPFIEEIYKFISSFLSSIKNKSFGDECTDPMIYSITAALGFAAAENLKVCLSILEENQIHFSGIPLAASLSIPPLVLNALLITVFLRFISAVFLHANAASIYGYFWGIGLILKKQRRIKIILIVIGIILATILHSCYNYLIMKTGENLSFILAVILLLVVSNYVMSRAFKQLKSYQQ